MPSALLRRPESGSGIYSSINTWIFKHRAPKGVALLLCCQQLRDLRSSPTSHSQGRRGAPHPIFYKLLHQENQKNPTETPQSQHRAMAQPLSWGCPAKPSTWDHVPLERPSHSYEGETLLVFVAKCPFHEKFGGVSRSLGFGSSLKGAETSTEAGSSVSQDRRLGKGVFWDLGSVNGAICGISPGMPGASRGKADFWGHQQH